MRSDALARRRSHARTLAAADRAEQEARLADIALPRLAAARVIAGYHPLRDEISPYPLLAGLAAGQRSVLPWFAGREAPMLFREAPAVEVGPWGMLQPAADAAQLVPDVVLVPLVAADRHGTRIGHGQGHYDRALQALRADGPGPYLIGIAWDAQISEEAIPADPWDIPLDAIATPAEWIACR
jgi:5-formyltetrahydrofolate cyclo-ligase